MGHVRRKLSTPSCWRKSRNLHGPHKPKWAHEASSHHIRWKLREPCPDSLRKQLNSPCHVLYDWIMGQQSMQRATSWQPELTPHALHAHGGHLTARISSVICKGGGMATSWLCETGPAQTRSCQHQDVAARLPRNPDEMILGILRTVRKCDLFKKTTV